MECTSVLHVMLYQLVSSSGSPIFSVHTPIFAMHTHTHTGNEASIFPRKCDILPIKSQSVTLYTSIPDASSQPALATPVIEHVDTRFQRLLEAVSKGEFPERGQRLLSKLSTRLSSSYADSDISSQGRDLNWDAPNISQALLQVSTVFLYSGSKVLYCLAHHGMAKFTQYMSYTVPL